MDETSKTFIKWEKFFRENPSFTASYEADPNICAKLLANQEEFENGSKADPNICAKLLANQEEFEKKSK